MAPFFVLISILVALLSNTTEADLIGNICSKSINPSSCNQALRSDPRSRGADPRGLGKIVIEKAQAATQESIKVAKAVTTGRNKEITKTCIENFNEAVGNLNVSKKLLGGNGKVDVNTLQTRASAALTDVGTCADEFGPSQPPRLKQVTAKANLFIQLLLVIAKAL